PESASWTRWGAPASGMGRAALRARPAPAARPARIRPRRAPAACAAPGGRAGRHGREPHALGAGERRAHLLDAIAERGRALELELLLRRPHLALQPREPRFRPPGLA